MKDWPSFEQIVFRIGISLGDVVHEADGDIFGEGVNMAARLEGIAQPGGICIGRNVYEQARNRLPYSFTLSGQHRLKNIAEPVEVWTVSGPADGRPRRAATKPSGKSRSFVLAAVAVVIAVVTAAAAWQFWPRARPLADRPSIAVLPMANLSGDGRWERLADGLTEDVITSLARRPELFVIARNSTMVYKGKSVDVRQVGRDLGVRHVLESSVQADSGRVRITAQLIDATDGKHLWAERYDRPESDLFAIQDEVVAAVDGAIGGWTGRIATALRAQAKRKPPANLEAYELYLIGMENKHEFTMEAQRKALASLQRAVELDPGFARGWAALGLAYSAYVANGFSTDPDIDNKRYFDYTKKAVALDPADALARVNVGFIRAVEGNLAAAEEDYAATLKLAPNDADVLALLAILMPLSVGHAEAAVGHARHAIALNPSTPAWFFHALGTSLFFSRSFDEAAAALQRVPGAGEPLMFLVLSEAMAGRHDSARQFAERLQKESPSFSIEGYIRDSPVIPVDARTLMREAAVKAGLSPPPTN